MNADPAGFEIAIRPSGAVRLLRIGMIGLGLAGCVLAAWLARSHDDGWIVLGFGVLMLWMGWRHAGAGLSWGTLRVTADGRAGWRPHVCAGQGGDAAFALARVARWHAGENLVWMRLRTGDGKRHEVLVSRTGQSPEAWRSLVSWLAWLRRGPPAS